VIRLGLWASVLAVSQAIGQPVGGLVDSIFQPGRGAVADTPVPLRPADPLVRRPMPPRIPPFALKTGDRVLLLGDALFEREAELGYLETRLSSQSPAEKPVFRNLSWYTNTPLAGRREAGADGAWLAGLRAQAALVKPTVVFFGYGTVASSAGETGVPAFRRDCERLRETLRDLDTNVPVRFVWFSPMFQDRPGSSPPTPDPRNEQLLLYTQTLLDCATNHQDSFVPAFDYLRVTAAFTEARGKTSTMRWPAQSEEGLRLTPYGYSRIVLAMERGLRWPANTWRFGVLTNGQLRAGGYGGEAVVQQRTDSGATISLLEERLPTPNPSGFVDLAPDTKPQSYIQMQGFAPGRYELRVEGQTVVVGSEADWGRYVILSEGPSWVQAEQLRQAIVAKNAAVTERWRALSAPPPSTSPLLADPQLTDLEGTIQQLQQPVRRKYEVVRVGEAPQAPAAPPPPVAKRSADGSFVAPTVPAASTNASGRSRPVPPPLPPPPSRK
jgi:hypothetical protein